MSESNELIALTIHEPWASLIGWGVKTVENRDWGLNRDGGQVLPVGTQLLIHAGKNEKTWDVAMKARCSESLLMHRILRCYREVAPWGCLIGVVTLDSIVDVAELEDVPFAFGKYCWQLREPRMFREPIEYRGAQGLWRVEEADRERVQAAIDEAEPGGHALARWFRRQRDMEREANEAGMLAAAQRGERMD